MSPSQRRLAGTLATIAVITVAIVYTVSRLRAIGREGWAGLAYIPGVSQKERPPIALFDPGSVFMVYPGGPAEQAGIARGDRIVAVNGMSLARFEEIDKLAARVRRGDVIRYDVKRGGRAFVANVRFGSPLESTIFSGMFAVTALVAFIYPIIGLFVFWRRPDDPRAVIFFIMTLCAAMAFMNTSLLQVESGSTRGIAQVKPSIVQIGRPLTLGAMSVFFAPLLLHLALIFPKPRPVIRRGRKLWVWIYGYPVFIVVCAVIIVSLMSFIVAFAPNAAKATMRMLLRGCGVALAIASLIALVRLVVSIRERRFREGLIARPISVMTLLAGVYIGSSAAVTALSPKVNAPYVVGATMAILIIIALASLASYPVATFIALYRSYRESGVEERRQVKWPLWGTMIAVGGKVVLTAIGTVISLLMTVGPYVDIPAIVQFCPDVISKLLFLLIPLSFAFAILKYRLMNIDVIIRRTVLYTILSAIVFLVYVVLVAGVGTLVVRFTAVQNQTMVIASTIVVGLIAIPLRNRLQRMVDRNLFRERRDYPLALRNISYASASMDPQKFPHYAAEQVQQALQNRFVLVATRGETHYTATAKVGVADEILGTFRVAVGETIDRDLPPLRRLGTEMVVPVRLHGETLGFLAIGSKLSDQELDDNDVEFLASAASQIALGFENTRLRTEEQDFAQARAMQQLLLPTRFPRLPGFQISGMWQPSRSVGGDYFDVIPLADDKVGICIGDVAGKGMPAALMMANLQAAVKATAGADVDPGQLCDKVKRVVSGNLAGGKFISFFYGVLDSTTRTFAYSNAGHNPPIVVHADGAIDRLAVGGPALCRLFKDEPHPSATITLLPGDRLVLFTDGASEARRGEQEFGEDRLAEVIAANRDLQAEELQQVLADAIVNFSGANFEDDLTMVVVSVE